MSHINPITKPPAKAGDIPLSAKLALIQGITGAVGDFLEDKAPSTTA
ncbi:MAG: hypothetical protein AAB353_06645 [Candidatus Hydrogenedentota bacterium]